MENSLEFKHESKMNLREKKKSRREMQGGKLCNIGDFPIYSGGSVGGVPEVPDSTINIPVGAINQFVAFAEKSGFELMGFLSAKLQNKEWYVNKILFPPQTGTEFTCEVGEDVSHLDDFLDEYCSHILGWIHSHPYNKAFLSSNDLHSTVNFQKLFRPYISIVHSYLDEETCIFRVPQEAINEIQHCQLTSFHSNHMRFSEGFATSVNILQE